jgi:integrase
LGKLKRRDLQDLVDRLALTLGENTVHNAITPVRAICRYALKEELLAKNPCDGLEVPKAVGQRFAISDTNGKREAIATREEAADLIDAISDPIDRALWATAFYAGLRRGELRGLFLDDIDLEAPLITIRRSWDALDGEIAPKSHHSARSVPISDRLLEILRRYVGQHDEGQFAFPGSGRWGKDYGPISADALLKRSRKRWKAAGLQPIGLHEARHTCASTMIAANVPIATVSRYMGHSSIAVTERVYFHLLPNAHEAALAAINAFLATA